jgi:N-acyl-D-amino-acid deacylase
VNKDLKQFTGNTMAQIAAAQKKDPLDALFDFILAGQGQTGALYFIASEEDLQYGLKQSWPASAWMSARCLNRPPFEPHTHRRAFGDMPRFLGALRPQPASATLEQGIRNINSLPAQREHLTNRGLLKEASSPMPRSLFPRPSSTKPPTPNRRSFHRV